MVDIMPRLETISRDAVSTSEEVYQQIKTGIVYLDYQPGDVLPIRKLANKIGVSATPICEALVRLEYDNLVHRNHNTSGYVSEISFKNLKDIFEVRLFLIEQAGRLAARRITDAELKRLEGLVGEIEQTRSPKKVVQLDAKCHEVIYDATKNQALAKVLGLLRVQITCLWLFIEDKDEFALTIIDDWERLVGVLTDRDRQRSAAIFKEHALKFIAKVRESIGAKGM